MVWYHLRLYLYVLRSGLDVFPELELIVLEQVNHDLLDLKSCKCSAGTCMPTIPEGHIRKVTGSPLRPYFRFDLS